MTTLENKKQNKFKNSISLKLIIVVMLSLILLIPSLMVKSLISERESRKQETLIELTSKWGGNQVISGPILVVPYQIITTYTDGKQSIKTNYFQILPSTLKIDGNLETEIRHRGIYDVLLYSGDFSLSGTFHPEDFTDWPDKYDRILWNDARLVLGISDTKGISKIATMLWNEKEKKFSPGHSKCKMVRKGINSDAPIKSNELNSFSINLSLNGSESAYFAPLGNETEVNLKSNWHTPNFDGWYITTENNVTPEGFTAKWVTNEMSRNFPQITVSENTYNDLDLQTFGVNLLLPVDTYQKSERSVKYAFLFIALTFLIIFFAEITGKIRVHPVQYLIIGLALVIFYSLLIALAEHISFNFAYLAASVVIITMIVLFTQALFKKWKNTLAVGTFLILLYAFLFTILQIADYALILGNIGLVLILGLVMFYSKKVDWYGSQNQIEEDNHITNIETKKSE